MSGRASRRTRPAVSQSAETGQAQLAALSASDRAEAEVRPLRWVLLQWTGRETEPAGVGGQQQYALGGASIDSREIRP